MASCSFASRVIPRITDSVKPCVRRAVRMTEKDTALTSLLAGGQFAALVARARIVFSKQTFRVLLTAGLGLLLATCRDGTGLPTSFAPIAVAPIFPSDASLASFGLAIDRVRFICRPALHPARYAR